MLYLNSHIVERYWLFPIILRDPIQLFVSNPFYDWQNKFIYNVILG